MKNAPILLATCISLLACSVANKPTAVPSPMGCSEQVDTSGGEWGPMKSPVISGRSPLFSEEMTERKKTMLLTLEANRERWRSHGICNYTITLEETDCYCFNALDYGPILNTVRNGKLIWAIYVAEPRDNYTYGTTVKGRAALKRTIEQLFGDVEQMIRHSTDDAFIQIEYQPEYGYPTVMAYDRPDWHDDQSRVIVTYFKPDRERH